MGKGRRVLLSHLGEGPAGERRESRHRGDAVFLALGLSFLVVGAVDVILLWIPPRFDSLAWEFATVGSLLDGFPLTALGLGLVAFGLLRERRSHSVRLRVLAVVCGLTAVLLLVAAGLLLTAAPSVLRQTPDDALDGVRRAVVRHSVQSFVYPLAFVFLTGLLWRASRSSG